MSCLNKLNIVPVTEDNNKLDAVSYRILSRWVEGDDTHFDWILFRHVVDFLERGVVVPRLGQALHEIGYTMEEIQGRKAEDIAKEVLARGFNV